MKNRMNALIVVALLFGLVTGCNDATKEAMFLKDRQALEHNKTESEEAVASRSSVSKTGKDKPADETVDTDDNGKSETPTGGKDGETDEPSDPVVPGKGGADDDTDIGGDDSANTPGQNDGKNPAQTPGKTDPVEIPPPEDDEDEVIIDLPMEACIYNDPDAPDFVIPKDQFGPALPPVDVPSSKLDGGIQTDGTTYIGTFSLFQKHHNSPEWMMDWDKKAGRIPHHFTMVVVGSDNSECTAYLRHVARDPRTLNGCFDQTTKIRMADGKDQMIALLAVGDSVWNPILKKPAKISKVVRGPEANSSMYKIGYGANVVSVTKNHPFPTKDGIKQAWEIKKGDQIETQKGQYTAVETAVKLPINKDQVVINISLESDSSNPDHHMVLADGVVSGDLFLQNQIEAKKSGFAQKAE